MFKTVKASLALSSLLALGALAQPAPLPPLIKIIVPFAAGASTDAAARAVASELAKRTGSKVIVDNQPGASTFIGVAAAAKAPKDGSVLLMTSTSTITAAATKQTVPLDITAADVAGLDAQHRPADRGCLGAEQHPNTGRPGGRRAGPA